MELRHIFALSLALIMIISAFTACGGKGDTAAVTTAAAEETAVEPVETEITSGLDPADFDGYKFHIYRHDQVYDDFRAEDLNGEALNDAMYMRMKAVEDACNVEIIRMNVSAGMRDGHTPLGSSVLAGSNDYDLCEISSYSSCNALTAGYLYDLARIENLDLSREWWDQYAVEDCTFGKSIYLTTGDISICNNQMTFCIFFNKKLAANYELPNLYDMVKNDEWTIDNFKAFAGKMANMDTDNDGNHVNDKDDAYGIYIWDDIMMGIINASGIRCCQINAGGELELTLYSEKFVDAFNKFADYAYDKSITCAYQRNGYDADWGHIAFKEDRALFYLSHLGKATSTRDMESDFGILPLPMYDENQERYYNAIASWGSAFYSIPLNAWETEEYERAGYITQLLGFESMKTLTPAYYDITLKGKSSRDEESSEMLDLLFNTRCYDFGWYFEIGGYNEGIMNLLRAYDTGVASMYEKSLNNAEAKIMKINLQLETMREA